MCDSVFQDIQRVHYQWEGNYCVASGMECILKWHKLIPVDSYPFQSNPKNAGIGFGEAQHLLNPYKIIPQNPKLNIEDTLNLISKEMNEERVVLIALPVRQTYCGIVHIFVALRHNLELVLFDPKWKHMECENLKDLTNLLHNKEREFPSRNFVDLLIYEL